MATVIAICNQKGGSCKTTTSLAIAENLIKRKKKTLFIDTDPQRNASSVYQASIEDTATLYDLLLYDDDTTVTEAIQRTSHGDIIASDDQLKDIETDLKANDPFRLKKLKMALEDVANDYDYCIIDTPPNRGVLLGNVLTCADYVIIPVTCDAFATQGIADLFSTIKMYKKAENPNLQILGLLKVRYKGRQNLTQSIEDLLDEVANEMGTTVFDQTIRESVKCQEAQALQESLFKYAPTCTAALDYDAFVKKEIIKKGL